LQRRCNYSTGSATRRQFRIGLIRWSDGRPRPSAFPTKPRV